MGSRAAYVQGRVVCEILFLPKFVLTCASEELVELIIQGWLLWLRLVVRRGLHLTFDERDIIL